MNPDGYADYMTLNTFFEGLGVQVKKWLVDIELAEDLFSRRIIWHWEHHLPLFQTARKRANDPTQYDSIEYLYNLMKHRQRLTTRLQTN